MPFPPLPSSGFSYNISFYAASLFGAQIGICWWFFYVIWFLLNFFISISPFSSLFCAYRNSFRLVCTFKRTILENSLHFQKEEMCYVIMGSNGNRVYRCIQVDGEIYGECGSMFFSL